MPIIDHISDKQLGIIELKSSERARYINFRYKNGHITMSIPAHTRYTLDELHSKIDELRPKLLKLLNKGHKRYEQATLFEGKIIDIVEGEIIIKSEPKLPRKSTYIHHRDNTVWALYNPNDNLSDDTFAQFFSKAILKHLTRLYGQNLQQLAFDCAKRNGITIKKVQIGRGRQRLGCCSSSGIITLSAILLLYPQHLREYIICHEMAHLKHFNHSEAFHKLCNDYCRGNEKQWNKELKEFGIPLYL